MEIPYPHRSVVHIFCCRVVASADPTWLQTDCTGGEGKESGHPDEAQTVLEAWKRVYD